MLRNIRILLQSVFNNKVMLVSYLIIVVLSCSSIVKLFALILKALETVPLNADMLPSLEVANRTLTTSILLFAFFLFFTYESAARAVTKNLLEPASAMRRGRPKLFFAIFFTNTILLFIINMMQLIINLIFLNGVAVYDVPIRIHVIVSILFNNFVIPCIAILLGIVAAFIKNRMRAYLFLIGIVFLISPSSRWLSYTLDGVLPGMMQVMTPFFDLFNLLPPSLDAMPNSVFGFSLLPYRLELAAIWFFGLMAVMLSLLARKRNRRASFLRLSSMILAIAALVFYMQPSSIVSFARGHRDSVMADLNYYENYAAKELLSEFVVKSCELDLRVGQMLHATVSMTVEPADLEKYQFTLYHNYKVNRVMTSDDEELTFEQDGDYLTVFNPKQLDVDSLIISYAGVSNRFFATRQGTYLPGFFCYYPRAGFHRIYDNDFEFLPLIEPSPIEFHVNIDSNLTFYSNLEKTDHNEFFGVSTGLTLVSGFYREVDVQRVRLILPSVEWRDGLFSSTWFDYVEQGMKKGIITSEIKSVFVVEPIRARSMTERMSEYSDHLVIQSFRELFEFYDQQTLPYYKQALFEILKFEERNPGEIEMRAIGVGWDPIEKNYAEEDPTTTQEWNYSFLADLFTQKGKANVLNACQHYLDNEEDTRFEMAFLLSLYDALPDLSSEQRYERDQQLLSDVLTEIDNNRGMVEQMVSSIRSTASGEQENSIEQFRISAQHLLDFDFRVLVFDILDTHGEEKGRQSIQALLDAPFQDKDIRTLLRALINGG